MGKREDSAVNTSCHVQILGVGTDTGCTVPSVLLFFDRKRYLFNVGEGFQRFCVEHKIKLTKVTSVLSTRATTHTLGGLPGMLLTMKDATAGGLLAGHISFDVHGPTGLQNAVSAFRTFINLKDMGLQTKQFGSERKGLVEACEPVVSNESVSIKPIIIHPAFQKDFSDEPSLKRQKVDGKEENGTTKGDETTVSYQESPVSAYICQLADIPGKFLPQKAASLGVPRGPLYGKLVKGETVQGANGRLVTPEEVMEPSTPGPTVILVDCPSEEYIPGLADTTDGVGSWAHQSERRDKVAVVIHLSPRDVLRKQEYLDFIATFPTSTQHILVSESENDDIPVMQKSAILHSKLNMLDPILFPKLNHSLEEMPKLDFLENWRVGTNMLKYALRPITKKGFNQDDCGEVVDYEREKEYLKLEKPDIVQILDKIQGFTVPKEGPAVPPPIVRSPSGQDIQVTFLGTGAAIPSKYRNVTGILLQIKNRKASILMDCGESSLGQLYKRFGHAGTNDILQSLKCIWISHIHADHHIGLPAVLGARSRLLGDRCDPVLVIGPKPLRKSLRLYSSLEPMNFHYQEASSTERSSDDTGPTDEPSQSIVNRVKDSLGVKRLESVRVIHCSHAFALILESSDFDQEDPNTPGWKIAFSGDTRPCPDLVHAAKNATLLIHEATFEDNMLEEAEEKRHSTTSEAISAGRESHAYSTILTHFSQRYPKIPVIDDAFNSTHVGVAFDLMTVTLADLPRLPLLLPAFQIETCYGCASTLEHIKHPSQPQISLFFFRHYHFVVSNEQERTMAACMTSNTTVARNVPCQISSRRQTARRAIPVVCKAQESDARVGGAQQAFAAAAAALMMATPMSAIANEFDLLASGTPDSYVIDDASVLNRTTRQSVGDALKNLEASKGVRVEVATVRKLEFESDAFAFGDKLVSKWFPGDTKNKGVLLVVTSGKDGALTGGESFMSAIGDDLIDSVIGENVSILTEEEKYNEAVSSSVNRIVAKLSGQADPGPPVRVERQRKRTYKTKSETDSNRNATSTIVLTLLGISVVVPMLQYFGYTNED